MQLASAAGWVGSRLKHGLSQSTLGMEPDPRLERRRRLVTEHWTEKEEEWRVATKEEYTGEMRTIYVEVQDWCGQEKELRKLGGRDGGAEVL